jgi:hypothetical protein
LITERGKQLFILFGAVITLGLLCVTPLSAADYSGWEAIAEEQGLEYKDGIISGEVNGFKVYARTYLDTSLLDDYPVPFTEVGVYPPEEKKFPVDVSLTNQGLLSGLVSGRDIDTEDRDFNKQFVIDVNPSEKVEDIFTPDIREMCLKISSVSITFTDEWGMFKVQERIRDRDRLWEIMQLMSYMARNQMEIAGDEEDPEKPREVPKRRPDKDSGDQKREGGGGGSGDVLD